MKYLVIDTNNQMKIERPYLSKYNDKGSVENSIWIGQDEVTLMNDLKEAEFLLRTSNYDSVIINISGGGVSIVNKLRQEGPKNFSVTKI